MSKSNIVQEVLASIAGMSSEERDELFSALLKNEELLEDLEDSICVMRSAGEKARPFEEFVAELRADGRDV